MCLVKVLFTYHIDRIQNMFWVKLLLFLFVLQSIFIPKLIFIFCHYVTVFFVYVVTVTLRHGYPVVSVPLPSRRENCDFTLRPYLQNVGHFINNVKTEDLGVDK